LDTAVALARRWLNRRPLFVSDRGHVYDQLMDRGMTLRQTVAVSYLLAGAYAAVGVLAGQVRFRWAVLVFVIVAAFSAAAAWRMGFLQMEGARGLRRAPRAKPGNGWKGWPGKAQGESEKESAGQKSATKEGKNE
ncbi:MAG: hypothetical protein JW741_10740, partial [Sedimentisphaerales bacterium]|nr:hypothetical protein [Sedimentisphaerales bacterium]